MISVFPKRHAYRQQHAVPLISAFRIWAIEQVGKLSPKSPTAKAFAYLDHHWPAFKRYTERGDLKIDNNAAERALRAIAIGRKLMGPTRSVSLRFATRTAANPIRGCSPAANAAARPLPSS